MTILSLLLCLSTGFAQDILFDDVVEGGVSVDATGVDASSWSDFAPAKPLELWAPDDAEVQAVYLLVFAKIEGFGAVTVDGIRVSSIVISDAIAAGDATLVAAEDQYLAFSLDPAAFDMESGSAFVSYAEHSSVETDGPSTTGISGATMAMVYETPSSTGSRHVVIAADDVTAGASTFSGLPEGTSTGQVTVSIGLAFNCAIDQESTVTVGSTVVSDLAGGRDDGPPVTGVCGAGDWNSQITQGSFGFDDDYRLIGVLGDEPDEEPTTLALDDSRLSDELYLAPYDGSGDLTIGYTDPALDSRMNGIVLVFEMDADADGVPDVDDNCPDVDNPDQLDTDSNGVGDACEPCLDIDGDGYGAESSLDEDCRDDCDDANADINPGATEIWYDGVDSDCDEWSDFDADRDGSDSDLYGGDDCDDTDADYSPDTLVEVWYDGVDHDCGEDDDYDADADGYVPDEYVGSSTTEVPASGALPGGDCNDLNAAVNPGVSETWYDGVDGNCDGASDFDADGDTHDHEDFGGDDCDDEDFRVYPGATEIWYDGVDSDCSGGSDYDVDGDGHDFDEYGGSDCDDNDPSINADATDVWYDGVDQDCRGDDDFDADKDGYVPDEYDGIRTVGVPGSGGLRAGDCDDGDVAVHPGAVEVWYDGLDNDCSGGSDYDADGDGYDSLDWADGDDCDDGDDTVYPGASDTWYDGVDQDCDGAKDDDADGDGFGDADDCDDDDPDIYPDKPGYDGCTPIDNSIEIYSGGGCKGCASGGATESSPFAWWAGLCGLLLGFRRRRRLT